MRKKVLHSRHRWPCGLRSVVDRLLGLWVRIQPEHVFVYCKCCVLSGGGLCIGPITLPTECGVSLLSVISKPQQSGGQSSSRTSEPQKKYILDMIYLLTAIRLSPGGCSTVHICTQTIHRTIRNKQYIEQHNNFGRVGDNNCCYVILYD
jgi:hypothetical protein